MRGPIANPVIPLVSTALLFGGSPVAPILADSDPLQRVRTPDRQMQGLLVSGIKRSTTLQEVVSRFGRTGWVVFLLPGRCPDALIVGCLLHTVTDYHGSRTLRIVINIGNRRPNTVTATIAHELKHALEVAESGEVVDNQTLRRFFERFGRRTIDLRGVTAYETVAAEEVEARVFDELRLGDAVADNARRARIP
jgi:hypothetical protein